MLLFGFVYETFTLYGYTFQNILLPFNIQRRSPTTPDASIRFALFRFRSPLLPESLLISLPLATEMFHFTRLAPAGNTHHCVLGCPIRISLDQSLLAAPQSFSQLSTSFIASYSLGIHHSLLIAYLDYILICITPLLNITFNKFMKLFLRLFLTINIDNLMNITYLLVCRLD